MELRSVEDDTRRGRDEEEDGVEEDNEEGDRSKEDKLCISYINISKFDKERCCLS